jgi:hypothetical protein
MHATTCRLLLLARLLENFLFVYFRRKEGKKENKKE